MKGSRVQVGRRAFLGGGIAAAAGAAASCGRNAGAPSWRFFTAGEARAVDALCEQLIPADRDPGAHDANVVNYIDLQLVRSFRKHQQAYRQGIAALDAAARKQFGKRFAELPADQQAAVLTEREENAKPFFDLILTHTRQGFYGDPRHGGNRNMASWKMLGVAYPPVRGRQHYSESKAG
jgi:gluconate 2-dehydrogenase gamma chain